MLVCSSAAITTARVILAGLVLLAFSAAASAGRLAFVAEDGNDANPCTAVAKPCKTLQRAVNTVAANGTVRVLTPLQASLSVTKSVVIEGDGATLIGAIVVNSPTAVVTLRKLALNGGGSYATGIRIDNAAAVHIEDCTVEHYTNDGIKLVTTTSAELFVLDTASLDNGSDGLYVDAANAQVVIQNSRFENNASTGLFLRVRRGAVTRSIAAGNLQRGIILFGGSASFDETTVADNGNMGFYIGSGGAMLASSVFHGNTSWGVYIASGATAMMTDSIVSQNSTGIFNDGTLNTFADNQLIRNNSFAYQGTGHIQTETPF